VDSHGVHNLFVVNPLVYSSDGKEKHRRENTSIYEI
jgi:hypothetical protein